MKKIKNCIKLMRPKHYFKNLLVLLPLIFSKQLFNTNLIVQGILGFISFSLMASMIYIINDIKDVEKDRQHPKKKFRPIACNKVNINEAIILEFILVIIILGIMFILKSNIYCYIILITYFIINIFYSFGLKKVPIIDVSILTFGFILRLMFGSFLLDITISNWLYLTVLSFSFYLSLGKRRNEHKKSTFQTRDVLKHYNKDFLDKNMYMFLSLTLVFYSLWVVDANTIANFNKNLIYTIPIVMIICMKYSMNIESDNDGDPVEVIFEDKTLLGLIMLYGITLISIIYI